MYDRKKAVKYAYQYALTPNEQYIYFKDNDCTNFVSQCLRAGGAKDDYNKTHPWWYKDKKCSICWSVAASLYWYIKVSTEKGKGGIKAKTIYLNGDSKYKSSIADILEVGDIVQYRNEKGRIQHSAIITGFIYSYKGKEPLISQHTFEGLNVTWRKKHKQTIFHHIKL